MPMMSKAPPAKPFRAPRFVWVVMLVAFVFSFGGWLLFHQYINGRGIERFEDLAQEMRLAIEARMQAYEQVLRSGVGLFKASDFVSRDEWHIYVANAKLQEYYPGIQGFGFSKILDAKDLPTLEQQIRAEGFSDFTVYPANQRERYHVIIYLEPFDWRNQRAFGYDMYTEPNRRRAIDWAMNSGNAAVSAKITLVQETGQDVQAGFLMYLPLYADERNSPEAVTGMVYAAFRVDDLMRGILGNHFPALDLEIYDGSSLDTDALMYSSAQPHAQWHYQTLVPLQLGGHQWQLNIGSTSNFISDSERLQSGLMLLMAVIFQLLMFYFLVSIARARHQEALLSDEVMANERRFRLVVEASPSALIITDNKGIITLVNIHTEQLFGYTREELLGQSVNMLLPGQLQGNHQQHIESYLANPIAKKMSLRDELYGSDKKGRLIPIEVGLTPIHFASGMSVLATINDISVRRSVEVQRLAHTRELERINKELDSFAYIASHDLKSPLRGIEQLSVWIEEDLSGKLDKSTAKYLKLIRSRIDRMSNLLDGLLMYSRIGRIEEAMSDIELGSLVRDTFAYVAPPSGFELKISSPSVQLHTARVPLELVFRNLFANAIKHHDLEKGVIEVNWTEDEHWLQCCVSDDGPGIAPEYQEKVFEIFQTLKSRDEVEGCGLGLSLVRKTVERYGGKVWLESSGRGCRFWFSWPEHMEATR